MFYNAHAHSFILNDVPELFAGKILWKKIKTSEIKALVTHDEILGFIAEKIPLIGDEELGRRIKQMAYEAQSKTQEEIIRKFFAQYDDDNEDVRIVLLAMDMWFMDAGEPARAYIDQLNELKLLKRRPEYRHKIYPFVCIDPRRGFEKDASGETDSISALKLIQDYINPDAMFQGIKIYPALGFWPFDVRLIPSYQYAQTFEIPVMTHCAQGPVFYRGDEKDEWKTHPVTQHVLPRFTGEHFSSNFTNPLNYECLLNQKLLQQYYTRNNISGTAPDLSKLKICIAHFGGGKQWKRYYDNKEINEAKKWQIGKKLIKNSQVRDVADFDYPAGSSLDVERWNKKQKNEQFTWLTIVCDLIEKYDNVYTDISSTLADDKFIEPLKEILNRSQKIKERVLFGSDYYVVGNRATEDEFRKDIRDKLGKDLFDQIARINVERYLENKIVPLEKIKVPDSPSV